MPYSNHFPTLGCSQEDLTQESPIQPPFPFPVQLLPPIITENLILHLDAGDSNSYSGSGNTWTDLSGEGHNATIYGATYNSGDGGYFDFDGTNDYATLPTLNIAGNELTFSVWNYGIVSQLSSIIFLGDTGQSEGGRILQIHLPHTNNTVYFDKGWDGSAYDRIYKNATNAEYQGWHHWAFTANASTGSMKIYLDATLWHSGTGKTKTFSNVNGNVRNIGENHSGYHHRGYISNLQIYKKELSASEVLQNYDAHKSRFGY